MNRLWSTVIAAIVLLFINALSYAQAPDDKTGAVEEYQPPDLHYQLTTKDGRTIFHLGEAIELEESYSADVADKYLLLSLPAKINGHAAKVAIEPSQGVIDRHRDQGTRSAYSILHVNCLYGIGSGIGSGCGDCDDHWPLKSSPIRFPLILTNQFQITEPGQYSLQAKAANVVVSHQAEQLNVPITLTSNRLEIEIVEDPQWSSETLYAAMDRFDKAQAKYASRGWNSVSVDKMGTQGLGDRMGLEAEVQQAAETMKLLDTEDSLAEIVRRYVGDKARVDYYRYILYSGIIQSRHRSLAIALLAQRMLQPDFSVSDGLIDQLTAMTLLKDFPLALDSEDASYKQRFYPAARKILQSYVQALGKSLPNKNSLAFEPSLKAFNSYASQDFCTGKPLISLKTRQEITRQTGTSDQVQK